MKSDKRLYLTADRSRAVEEGDPDAAFLLVGEGDEVPAEHLDAFKAYRKGGDEPQSTAAARAESEDESRTEAKAAEPAEDKAQARPAAKAK